MANKGKYTLELYVINFEDNNYFIEGYLGQNGRVSFQKGLIKFNIVYNNQFKKLNVTIDYCEDNHLKIDKEVIDFVSESIDNFIKSVLYKTTIAEKTYESEYIEDYTKYMEKILSESVKF